MKAGEGTEGSISSLSGLWSEKAVPPLTELVDTEERYLAKLADLHLHFSQRLHAEIAVHGQRKTQVTDKDVEFWFQLLPVFQTHHQDLILLLKSNVSAPCRPATGDADRSARTVRRRDSWPWHWLHSTAAVVHGGVWSLRGQLPARVRRDPSSTWRQRMVQCIRSRL